MTAPLWRTPIGEIAMRLHVVTLALALAAVLVTAPPARTQTCAAEINAVSTEVGEARYLSAADLQYALELLQIAKAQCVDGDEPGALAMVEQIRQLLRG